MCAVMKCPSLAAVGLAAMCLEARVPFDLAGFGTAL
jgi:hypothetical protein